jgi:predicted permease
MEAQSKKEKEQLVVDGYLGFVFIAVISAIFCRIAIVTGSNNTIQKAAGVTIIMALVCIGFCVHFFRTEKDKRHFVPIVLFLAGIVGHVWIIVTAL